MNNELIVKHNDLIEANYSLNLIEQKIIIYMASKINPQKDIDFNIISFSIKEFTQLIGTTSDRYSEIRKIVKNLQKKIVTIKKSDGNILDANWVSSAEYKTCEGMIDIEFSSKLKPYFLQLHKNFTSYEKKYVLYFKNVYSLRIYELLKKYEHMKARKNGQLFRFFTIDELKCYLDIVNKYSKYNDLKRNVLNVAIDEINKYTDIKNITFTEKKEIRSVIGITIHFDIIKSESSEWNKLVKDIDFDKHLPKMKEKLRITDYDFTDGQLHELFIIASKISSNKDIDVYTYLFYNFAEVQKRKDSVINIFSYFKKALEHNYAKI